ncbi:MAG: class I tRNA ligase family protein, partial [Dehalococcoidia bacterium]
FFWGEFADWYLEMAKVRLRKEPETENEEPDRSPLPVLAYVLDTSLRLLHPFLPFVTEAAWQKLRQHIAWAETEALIVAAWPKADRRWIDAEAEAKAQVVMEVVRAIRNIRAEKRVDPARYVEAYVAASAARPTVEAARPIVETLARVRPLHLVEAAAAVPRNGVATAVLPDASGQVALPLAGLMDVEAERDRLAKQLAAAEAEVRRGEGRLANRQFRAKAPRPVVAREEEKLASARSRLEALRQRLSELG